MAAAQSDMTTARSVNVKAPTVQGHCIWVVVTVFGSGLCSQQRHGCIRRDLTFSNTRFLRSKLKCLQPRQSPCLVRIFSVKRWVSQLSNIIYFLNITFSMIVVVSYKHIWPRNDTLTQNRCGSGRPISENVRAVPACYPYKLDWLLTTVEWDLA